MKMSFFDHYLNPGDKMKILKPYCAFSRHTHWDPRVSFLKFLKCRRTSSDKLFFRTDGRTERGNNNMPELSLKSAGIIRKKHCTLLFFKHYCLQNHRPILTKLSLKSQTISGDDFLKFCGQRIFIPALSKESSSIVL